MNPQSRVPLAFTPYQKFVVALLAFLQFTIILDFMILSPLGAILIPQLNITPVQFGAVVSAYAFSAGLSGLIAAGFADRFDRKKMLLFFYTGFVVATLFCGIAPNYELLLVARMMTGIFGGVIGSIVMAITTDLFPFNMRGRVMGVVMTAFAASQVLGIPVGLVLANAWGWHAPFLMIVGVSSAVGVAIVLFLKPINEHLQKKSERSPFRHLLKTVTTPRYVQGYTATMLLSTGGFMLMPFSSAFMVHNVQISIEKLPIIYAVTGVFSIFMGPLIGRMCDRLGKFKVFAFGCFWTILMVTFYTHLGPTSIPVVIFINVLLFLGITSRMISSSALMSAVPKPEDRGAYMAVSNSLQQISGGVSAAVAGLIVFRATDGHLEHFDRIGYVVTMTTLITMVLMYFIDRRIQKD